MAAATGVRPERPAVERWLRGQLKRYYWRVFALGLIAYAIAAYLLDITGNPNTVPLVTLLASAVIPVSFVVFCWEQGAPVAMPPLVLGLAFCSGSTIGLFVAAYLEGHLVSGHGVGTAIAVAFCEEAAKVAAVCWFLRDRRLRSEFHGLLLGAAVGMGFAALETAGYGFTFFLSTFIDSASGGEVLGVAFKAGVKGMLHVLNVRMELAAFGHGVWTAIVCAAIWRERGSSYVRVTAGVVLSFAIAAGLHATWDSLDDNLLPHFILGAVGLLVLRFFILDAIEQTRRDASTPPVPLPDALRAYFEVLWRRSTGAAKRLHAGLVAAPAEPQRRPAPQPAGQGAGSGTAGVIGVRCPNCRQLSAPSARFCARCGAVLPGATGVSAGSTG
jgi:RsiW-degrading membrane proteinase PrsW (M82 family)